MTTMVERLSEVLSKRGFEIDPDMFHYTPHERPESYKSLAVAVLEAMMEPTTGTEVFICSQSGEGYLQSQLDRAVKAERSRCLTIIQSIETTSAQGMRVIDEIVRKVRGEE